MLTILIASLVAALAGVLVVVHLRRQKLPRSKARTPLPTQDRLLARQVAEIRQERQALEEQLGHIAAAAPGVICSWRVWPDGHTTMPTASPAIVDVCGFSADEVAGNATPLLARIHQDDRRSITASIAASARTLTAWHAEWRYAHPTKGERWLEGRSMPQREPDESTLWHGFVTDVTERKQVVQDLARSHDELRDLSSSLIDAREQERRHISRELHDELGQQLAAIKLDLSAALALAQGNAALQQCLGDSLHVLDLTVASVRRIAADLRPTMLDDLGLEAALEWLASDWARRTQLQIELDCASVDDDITSAAATTIYRVIQEALTNVSRHSQASKVIVAMQHDGTELVVSVTDNDRGSGPDALSQRRKNGNGHGLLGMRERARLLGGTVSIGTSRHGGSRLEMRLPLHRIDSGAGELMDS